MKPEDKLTANFTVKEFFCTSQDNPAGIYQFSPLLWQEFQELPDQTQAIYEANLKNLAEKLQQIRNRYGKPLRILSGWRSKRLNKQVGGSAGSYHLTGMAADISVEGILLSQLHDDYNYWPGGLAKGRGFVHFDIRPYRARWVYGS